MFSKSHLTKLSMQNFKLWRLESTSTRINPLMAHLQPDAEAQPIDLAYRPKKIDPWTLYQPFIDRSKPIPVYNTINLRFRGYDFVVLEHYQRYAYGIVAKLGVKVKESFATAAKTSKTLAYKPRTTAVESEYHLSTYERTIQLPELETTKSQLLVEILRTNLPVGVEFTVKYPDIDDDKARYLPDVQLRERQAELELLVNPKLSQQEALTSATSVTQAAASGKSKT